MDSTRSLIEGRAPYCSMAIKYWLAISLFLVLTIKSSAQNCVDTVYLEAITVNANEVVKYQAFNAVYCLPGKVFVVTDKGQAFFTAGGRIELNPGFAVLNGGGLSATIANCGDANPSTDTTKSTLSVFPNPTDGVLYVKATYIVVSARILDGSGLVLIEKTDINDTTFGMDISKAKAGVYLLEVISAKANEKLRILKN